MAAGSILTGIVQQTLPNVLPDRVFAIEAARIDGLDLNGAVAAPAGDAQHVALYLSRRCRSWAPLVPARASFRIESQYSAGSGSSGAATGTAGLRAASEASFSICLGVGMRQLAGRSVIIRIEHKGNSFVELFVLSWGF
jgi:hypothetical protein